MIVFMVIFLEDTVTSVRLTIYTMFQVLALMYIAFFMPFETVKDNLVEMLNDTFYVVLCVLMIILNQVDFVSSTSAMPMVYTVMINGAMVIIVMYVSILIDLIKKCKRKKIIIRQFPQIPDRKIDAKTIVIDYANDSRYCLNETPSLPYEMNRQSSRRNTDDSKYYEDSKRHSNVLSKLNTMKTLPFGANIKDDVDR